MRRILQWAESPLSLTHLFGGANQKNYVYVIWESKSDFYIGYFSTLSEANLPGGK